MTTSHDEWAPDAEQGSQPQPAAALWPEGNYEGEFLSGEYFSSNLQGTPGIKLKLNVGPPESSKEVEVNCWLTDSAAEMSIKALAAVGWNTNVTNPGFSVVGPVKMYMRHGNPYGKKQVVREEWSISTFEAKPLVPVSDPTITRFVARFKAAVKPPPPPPGGTRPTAPAPAASAPSAPKSPPPPPAKAPPRPAPAPAPVVETNPERLASTQDEAWGVWLKADCADANMFYDTIERIAKTNDPSAITPEQWQAVASSAPPF